MVLRCHVDTDNVSRLERNASKALEGDTMTQNNLLVEAKMASKTPKDIRDLTSAEVGETTGGMLPLSGICSQLARIFELVGCGEDEIGTYCEYKVTLPK
jgi:hypothetical protein